MELVSYSSSQHTSKLPPLHENQIVKINNEIGEKYTLANSVIPHSIPPINSLKANVDHQSGTIDTWPAHSANQRPSNMQLSLNKHKHLILSNSQAEGKPELTPKPKFLENLEKFLKRELKALGVYNSEATSESRLQAYREVFEYLLEEFKTYKPLLASIKNEYEMMLASQREKIRELEPLKQMLVTLADQCDHKLMLYREEEKIEIKQLKEDKKKLMDMVMQLKNDRQSLHTQVEKLQNELSLEHERFRNEQDKKKLLIIDLNDLRFQQEEAKLAELKREKKRNPDGSLVSLEEEDQDDPVTLKIALRTCRRDLTEAQKRLTKIEADYSLVVPLRDFEALEKKYKGLESKNESLENDLKSLRNEQGQLGEYSRNLAVRLQELQQELEITKGDNTPRPDWDRCTSVVEPDRWRDLSNNKSSIQILDALLFEMESSKTGGGGVGGHHSKAAAASHVSIETFHGYGTGPEVPAHLRYAGQLRNPNLSKTAAIGLVTDILRERMEHKNAKSTEDMSDYLLIYLKKRYSHEAFEYSYAINDILDKHSTSNEILKFFAAVLSGQTDEENYYFNHKLVTLLMDHFKEIEVENGFISKSDFKETLKLCFPSKNSDQLDALVKAADDELGAGDHSKIEYKHLFGEESHFFSKSHVNFKSYLNDEKNNLMGKIIEHLGGSSVVHYNDVKKAIAAVETVTETDVEKILNFCFNAHSKQVEMDAFKSRLEQCCLHNYPHLKSKK